MKIKNYFTNKNVIDGLIISFCISAFIYFEYFSLFNGYILYAINSILAVFGLYKLIVSKRAVWFFSGFFIALFWFWWIGVSFFYYDLIYIAPFIVLLIGTIYGFIFLTFKIIFDKLASLIKIDEKFTNALAIFLISYIEPLKFNWLKLQVSFIDSVFGVEWWQFTLILVTISLFAHFKKWWILIFLVVAIDLNKPQEFSPKSLRDIELVSTDIKMREKWLPKNQQFYTSDALDKIDIAISKDKKLIIFPESYLPYFLNLETIYLKKFLKRSERITIIIGSLYYKGVNNHRNSAYIIKDGDYQVANKVVLVPFGESNPLPEFLNGFVNRIFFDGAIDYSADKNFTYIKALDKNYKIGICYEATSSKTYEDRPPFLIVMSNNGWFVPSIEPTLQKLIIKYYSKLNNTTVYHSINGSNSYIIMPFEGE